MRVTGMTSLPQESVNRQLSVHPAAASRRSPAGAALKCQHFTGGLAHLTRAPREGPVQPREVIGILAAPPATTDLNGKAPTWPAVNKLVNVVDSSARGFSRTN